MQIRIVRPALLAIGIAMLVLPLAVFAQPLVERPVRGQTLDAALIWGVSHQAEEFCTAGGSSVAGAASVASGHFSQLGDITTYIDAAWDWSVPVNGAEFTPVGPTTAFSATVLPATGSLPHTFAFDPFFVVAADACKETVTATGQVTIIGPNGDLITGQVTGGEVYELDFSAPGDGQEQFLKVDIDGGTGRFVNATGSFVSHSVFSLTPLPVVLSNEIIDGIIEY